MTGWKTQTLATRPSNDLLLRVFQVVAGWFQAERDGSNVKVKSAGRVGMGCAAVDDMIVMVRYALLGAVCGEMRELEYAIV